MEIKSKKNSNSWFILLCSAMALFLVISLIIAIHIGAVSISPNMVYKIVMNKLSRGALYDIDWTTAQENIVWQLRFPKVIVAAIVGGGLALSGIFMQALTKNPLADPYILGISAGASTGAVISILIGGIWLVGSFSVQTGAFCGAVIASCFVFALDSRGIKGNTTKLVLIGVAVSAIFMALTDFIIFVTPDSRKVATAMFWMMGSFGGVLWKDVAPAFLALLIGLVTSYFIHRELDIFLLGEDSAKTYGVNTKLIRIVLLVVGAILTSTMVSISGIIGFVGLIIPHVSRSLVGSVHRKIIPFAVLLGAIFMIWADVFARVVAIPEELPTGILTAMLGGPFFLYLIKKSKYSFGN